VKIVEYLKALPFRIFFGNKKSQGASPLFPVLVIAAWILAGFPLGIYGDSFTVIAGLYVAVGVVLSLILDYVLWTRLH
jgi:hypothetical protein